MCPLAGWRNMELGPVCEGALGCVREWIWFKAERPWVFTPGSCPWFLRLLSLLWRVVAAGTGDDADGVRGVVQQELGKRRQKKRTGVSFPQRKAESDFEATEGESLRESEALFCNQLVSYFLFFLFLQSLLAYKTGINSRLSQLFIMASHTQKFSPHVRLSSSV